MSRCKYYVMIRWDVVDAALFNLRWRNQSSIL